MLEAVLIMSIVYACMYMPLRGKALDDMTNKQLKKVEKNYARYMKTKKGKQTPDMGIEDYLPIIQKQALTYLIIAIIMLPIYIAVIVLLYSGMF